MKDYYQILGIGDRASQEEIHDRWLKLTEHYPHGLEGGEESHERIQEINEAYQILRAPNLKFEYDLRVNFKKSVLRHLAGYREKRKIRIKRMASYWGGLAIFLVLGSLIFLFAPPWISKEFSRVVVPEGTQIARRYPPLEFEDSHKSGKSENQVPSVAMVPPDPNLSESLKELWEFPIVYDPDFEKESEPVKEGSVAAAKEPEEPGGAADVALLEPSRSLPPAEPKASPIAPPLGVDRESEPIKEASVTAVKEPEEPGGAPEVVPPEPSRSLTPIGPKESPVASPPAIDREREPIKEASLTTVKEPERSAGATKPALPGPFPKVIPEEPKKSPIVSDHEFERGSETLKEASVTAVEDLEGRDGAAKVALLEPSRSLTPIEPKELTGASPPGVGRKSEPIKGIPDPGLKKPGLSSREAKVTPSQQNRKVIPKVAKTPTSSSVVPAISGESDVRQFLGRYADRYNQKDIDGFISFFSPKAVQNQKDDIEKIRKVYANFFQHNEKLRYKIRDVEIQPHKDGFQVFANYELEGILKKGKERKVWRGQVRWVLIKEKGTLKVLSLDYQSQKSGD